jgi:hypothetical protein
MSKPIFDVFNILSGKFERTDIASEDFYDHMAKVLANETTRLLDMYKAEREIVTSIINKAAETEESKDRSMD